MLLDLTEATFKKVGRETFFKKSAAYSGKPGNSEGKAIAVHLSSPG
jgi:hypothetical protein